MEEPSAVLCPYCKVDRDKVVDSRSGEGGHTIRRRRECLACGRRFTTYERIEGGPIRVVKKTGSRQGFDRNKLRTGVEKACWNLPISAEQIDAVADRIEKRVIDLGERELPSETLGEFVMEELKGLHHVAYVRFASVYRQFEDVTEFMRVIADLEDEEAKRKVMEELGRSGRGSQPSSF